jgi:hypothetical protein
MRVQLSGYKRSARNLPARGRKVAPLGCTKSYASALEALAEEPLLRSGSFAWIPLACEIAAGEQPPTPEGIGGGTEKAFDTARGKRWRFPTATDAAVGVGPTVCGLLGGGTGTAWTCPNQAPTSAPGFGAAACQGLREDAQANEMQEHQLAQDSFFNADRGDE